MTGAVPTFRIYLCSSFRDMPAERKHLHDVVFPELRRRCAERGLTVEVIDLRTAARYEVEAEGPAGLKRAFDEIETCRPWFLCLLGERYGPVLRKFPDDALEAYPWLREADPASRLELEIVHGFLLSEARPIPGFFYVRDPEFLKDVPEKLRPAYTEPVQASAERLAELKRAVRDSDSAWVQDYRCAWDADAAGVTDLTQFGEQVLADLWQAILSETDQLVFAPPDVEFELAVPISLNPPALEDEADLDEDTLVEDEDAPAKGPVVIDEDVQFTVYRPRVVQPGKWYPMLAFAHLSERPPDAPPGSPDPIAEVLRQAKDVLGKQTKDYHEVTQDSRAAVPREGEITFVPEMDGVEFNPPRRTFLWQEPVHREEFRLRASPGLDGKTVRGRLTVFLGTMLLADVSLSLRVDSAARASAEEPEPESGRPYRKIFASYSHRDIDVVRQVEHFCLSMGDQYLRDWTHLRSGEVWNDRLLRLIEEADVFQLFWSRNSMTSAYCKQEWEHALSLGRPNFVRPVYWEEPLPTSPDGSLPPAELRRLHFQKLFVEPSTHPEMPVEAAPATSPLPIHEKLSRVRSPRVRITYDVETAGAASQYELPFVVGVLADLSGQPREPRPFRSRQFMTIDRDNFNDVMGRIAPRLVLRVGGSNEVELTFREMDDFLPERLPAGRLREVLGHPDFRQLESTWRGLHYLVHQTETSATLKIRVLDVSKGELLADFQQAPEFDQSQLFKKVYEAEYGQLGGQPYGLLVSGHSFGPSDEDVALLTMISHVAATALAPFVAAADPRLLGLNSWTELDLGPSISGIDSAAWTAFRDSEDSRYVALTLPGVLARPPRDVNDQPLWMSAAWAYAARVTDAVARDGWCARIRGVEGGGRVEGLPEGPDLTEVALNDRQENDLSRLGLLALVHSGDGSVAAFLGAHSCHRPRLEKGFQGANANAESSAWLNHTLCAARFGQILALMARDQTGSFVESEDRERRLNDWINDYVLENPETAGAEQQGRRPLRAASVEVRSVAGKPGWLEVVARLQPHFQLENLGTSLRVVTLIPKPADGGPPPVTVPSPVVAPPVSPSPVDENVQFTVYRPRVVRPEQWYTMLAFAHLSERPPDAPPGTPDPVAEVLRQAKDVLGKQAKDYHEVTQDSRAAVPREGELTFVPEIEGVTFNPPRRTFLWEEPVHREEFRLKASPDLDGKTVRGRLTVFLGTMILADVSLSLRVDSKASQLSDDPGEQATARPYRKIFASYSHRDEDVVKQVEHFCLSMGDQYLRDWTHLRSGEVWNDRLLRLIEEADVFQLFWSRNSMTSRYCRQEWEHALSLGRPNFVRPVYWEEPLPTSADGSLPPDELRRLHFQKLSVGVPEHVAVGGGTHPVVNPPLAPEPAVPAPANRDLAMWGQPSLPTTPPLFDGDPADWHTAPPPPRASESFRFEEEDRPRRRRRINLDDDDEGARPSLPRKGPASSSGLILLILAVLGLVLVLGLAAAAYFAWMW